jgi:hypothetical protein
VDIRVFVTLKDGGKLYVGDPAWLGYDGPKVAYFGPHPLTVPLLPGGEPLFCHITAPHYHANAPAPSPTMVLKDGAYWYMGPRPPISGPRSQINDVQAIQVYSPPRVDLAAAPPGFHLLDLGDAPLVVPPPPPPPSAGPGASSRATKAAAAPRATKQPPAAAPAAAVGGAK